MLRGYLCLAAYGAFMLPADLIQRTIIVLLIRLFPSRRESILSAWMGGLRRIALFLLRHVGGARFDGIPQIPNQPGVLILMNHQSLLDIPVLFNALDQGYLLFVARQRYARGIPLISHNIRLFGHPTVHPGRSSGDQLDSLRETAATVQCPLAIFPEGTRTKTGDIGRFRTAGLKAILAPRQWAVYLVVSDGLWQAAKLPDFVRKVRNIRARFGVAGPFPSPAPGEDMDLFIESMRDRMVEEHDRLRGAEAGSR